MSAVVSLRTSVTSTAPDTPTAPSPSEPTPALRVALLLALTLTSCVVEAPTTPWLMRAPAPMAAVVSESRLATCTAPETPA